MFNIGPKPVIWGLRGDILGEFSLKLQTWMKCTSLTLGPRGQTGFHILIGMRYSLDVYTLLVSKSLLQAC